MVSILQLVRRRYGTTVRLSGVRAGRRLLGDRLVRHQRRFDATTNPQKRYAGCFICSPRAGMAAMAAARFLFIARLAGLTRERCANVGNYSGTFSGTLCTDSGVFPVICSVFVRRVDQRHITEGLCLLGFYWSERRDLNSRPPVPQTGALTGLRYAPTLKIDYIPPRRSCNNSEVMTVTQALLATATQRIGPRHFPPPPAMPRLEYAVA